MNISEFNATPNNTQNIGNLCQTTQIDFNILDNVHYKKI